MSNVLFKQRTILIIACCLLLSFILLNVSSPHRLLVIEEAKTGKVLWQEEIFASEWFHHEYIHSVEKSIVIEKFKIDDTGQIFAMESWTRSFGAGLPYELKGNLQITDGYYILKDIYEPIEILHMQPSHLHLHTFHFRDEVLVLSEPPYTRTHLKIYSKPLRWYEYIYWSIKS
ncbi:DUF1850 domain-containing protein [Anaerobacillus sp. CMMVII]|uniref:DUF1850 domain-containing protein n=1 Tax=Anaerobacillus sp. CMMVII TaxID=2755588 RepID=UPI0021B734A7|nr:DUF1850 domain-containing protein [Anaerobacillus sp. CMMVII]MCT8136892.1 DUF1850 domain-containing protein [Anaerobacillus sp. CMMVII]